MTRRLWRVAGERSTYVAYVLVSCQMWASLWLAASIRDLPISSSEESTKANDKNSAQTYCYKIQVQGTLLQLGRTDEAVELMGRVVDIVDEKDEATVAWDTAVSLRTSKDAAHEELAFSYFQKALDLFRACSNNLEALRCLEQQASLADDQKRYNESEALHSQRLQLSLDVFGVRHPTTFECIITLGQVLQKQGKFAEAVRFHRLALNGRVKLYGMEHPITMASNRFLAEALREQGHLVEAEVLGRQSVQVQQRLLGWKHMDTTLSLSQFATTLLQMRRLEEAKALHDVIIFHSELVPAAFGANHGSIPLNQENLSEAERLLRKALSNAQEQHGDAHPDTIGLTKRLAKCLEIQERRDEITAICGRFGFHEE